MPPDEVPAPPAPTRLLRQPTFVVSAMVCAGYFLIARVVVNLFPFSTFAMYAGNGGPSGSGEVRGSHLLAVAADGRAGDVRDYVAWDCPPWVEAARQSISTLRTPPHFNVEDEIREYLEQHAQQPGHADPRAVPVNLVRRAWVFPPGGETTTEDLQVAACHAVPR